MNMEMNPTGLRADGGREGERRRAGRWEDRLGLGGSLPPRSRQAPRAGGRGGRGGPGPALWDPQQGDGGARGRGLALGPPAPGPGLRTGP